ncbi:YeeE/YedE family protein [Undibacterium arcticum]|uniref:YeeE/YedE family protein n=1 Tax=Undibacterium arcticum TaxID=1762892 RepID=A0ABV7F3R4_9BURK
MYKHLLNGRALGISGIVGGSLKRRAGDLGWRVAFVAGLILAPVIYGGLSLMPPIAIDASYPTLTLAGVLVGLGTRYGSGCTSGHGVCGLSRLSRRSLVATLCFMAAGFCSVFVVRHLLSFQG